MKYEISEAELCFNIYVAFFLEVSEKNKTHKRQFFNWQDHIVPEVSSQGY